MIIFSSISGFLNGIAAIIFGLMVLYHNPKGKVNKLMFLMSLSVAWWSISWGFQAPIRDQSLALFCGRMVNFGAIFIPIFFLHWILVLLGLESEKKSKIVLGAGYFITLIFALFSFTPYFVKSMEPKLSFPYYEEPGILYHFYLIFGYFGLAGYGIYNLFKSYKQSSDYKKAQIKFVLLGSALGFGGGATNYFLFYNIPIPPFGNPLVAVGFGLLAYAVIAHRLMDVKIVVSRLLIFAVWIFVLIRTFLSVSYQELIINASLLAATVLVGVMLIRSISKEIKLTKELLKQKENLLQKEKELCRTFTQIAEERGRRIEHMYRVGASGIETVLLEQKVKELEKELERAQRGRKRKV